MLLCCTALFAQQRLKEAERLFDEMAYVEAVKAYEKYFEKEGISHKAQGKSVLNMADAYYFTRDYEKAAKWYAQHELDDVRFNRYIQSLRIQKKYAEADLLTENRLVKSADELQNFRKQKHYLDSVIKLKPSFNVTHLPTNSRLADFGAAFYGNKIAYTSAKDTMHTGGRYYKYNEQPFLKLYVADRHEDGTLFNESEFFPENQSRYHNATAAFADSNTVYFSTNQLKGGGRPDNSSEGTNNLQLMRGEIDCDKMKVERLPFNSKDYSVAQPAVSADGNWLFFVSDMPGGYGGTDIYKVAINADGTFGQPQNLGPDINTPYKEMFPFVQADVLYFASEGHYGLGGLDVFKCEITGDGFSAPKNMGVPINSNRDDFAFIITTDGRYGYLSSNREGGRGDDDMYYFTKIKECEQTVSGTVVYSKSRLPVKGANVSIKSENLSLALSVITDAEGFYSLLLPCNTQVTIEVSGDNLIPEKKEVTTGSGTVQKIDFELTGYDDLVTKDNGVEKIDINPIYFDLDKFAITTQAAAELDKVVFAMKSFPEMVIKIESHTDSRASDDYNLTLSQNRASATYEYIISKGINPARIESVNGYGETRLLNGCSNDVPCTEEEHQINRRSDFIVVRK